MKSTQLVSFAAFSSGEPRIASADGAFLEVFLSRFLDVAVLEHPASHWVVLLLSAVIALGVSIISSWIVRGLLGRFAGGVRGDWQDRLALMTGGPFRLILFILAFGLLASGLTISESVQSGFRLGLVVGFVLGLTWLSIRGVNVLAEVLAVRFGDEADVSRSRGARTQVAMLRKIGTIVLIIIGAALALMQFELLRTVGASVLASAGVLGLVVGLAAQRSISNLLAGIQLSITQPIRLDDTLIVEGEWGWVEEITLTYVVIRVWDLRRLVVPVSRFLEQPFQNWTKMSPELLGTVFLHADYRVPIEPLRDEVKKLCAASEKWDGRAAGLVVTDVTERTLQVRALVSAKDAGSLWDLRCEVREGLVKFLQGFEGGQYLPKLRLDDGETALQEASG